MHTKVRKEPPRRSRDTKVVNEKCKRLKCWYVRYL
jgi:hypothetical protein